MTVTNTAKTADAKKFAWNKENSAQAVSMYQEIVARDGAEIANTDGLRQIMTAIGAVSPVSVRAKLTSAHAYVKSDKPRKTGGASSVRKAHYVRVFGQHAVEAGLVSDRDDLASLEFCKLETLETLAQMLGVSEEVKAAAGE